PLLQRYVDEVHAYDGTNPLARYPGSPMLVRQLLREQDRGVFCELQPEEAVALKQSLQRDARCAVHQRDGYAALKAFLPPKERRGLVLIDPPFEAQDGEFRLIEAALETALERWPTGMVAIWYPIKQRTGVMPFQRWLRKSGYTSVLNAELMIHPDTSPLRLNGCGMAIVNPPWQFDRQIADMLPALVRWLANAGSGSWRCEWLVEG
ncbi:MAG: 23S rRNA (adenine(2030)-N(6))-methyltransferase RlmJ, partial [Dokdonella sp.]